jgi:hypothetical protein
MSKKSAATVLCLLVLALVTVNMVAMPDLAAFLKVGTMDSMYATGKTVGSALGKAFGSSIFEFVGIVLFLA